MLEQRDELSADSYGLGFQAGIGLGREVTEIVGKKQVVVCFCCGSNCNLNEAGKVSVGASA